MGVMRFRVFPTQRITAEMLGQAYLSGFDRLSWPVETSAKGDELIVARAVSDSANLHVPWPVKEHGLLILSTGSLKERDAPYLLPLELARGTVVQVRNHLSDWQVAGVTIPAAATAKLAEAVEQLSWAAVNQDDLATCAGHAEAALSPALTAADVLAAAFTEQAIAIRRRNRGKVPALLGAELGNSLLDNATAKQYLRAFNAARVPIAWREAETSEGAFDWTTSDKQIQWCHKHGLKVVAGPLLLLDPAALPDWFYLFEDDFQSVLDFVSVFVRAAVARYRGKVDFWICAGRINAPEAMTLSETERLQLVARTVELVRLVDPDTPALVSFDQPWAEYMRDQESDFPPLQLADALVRAGLGLDGLMLEINMGYWPGGTLARHPLEFSRQLETWGLLGLPLWLTLSAPSATEADLLARRECSPEGGWTPAAQQMWAAMHVPLALARPSMQGVLWNQLQDSQPHDFPHAGLFDANRKAKPTLATLAGIKESYL